MRIAVTGARGRTGTELIQAAEARGWATVGLGRGDSLDGLAGCDAVVSAVGHTMQTPTDGVSTGTRDLIAAMKAHGVARLVVITGAMIGGEHLGLFYKVGSAFVGRSAQMRDRVLQETLVRDSGLDWTIIRPPMLTDGPLGPVYRPTSIGAMASVSRASLANAVLDAIGDASTIGQAFELASK